MGDKKFFLTPEHSLSLEKGATGKALVLPAAAGLLKKAGKDRW